MPLHLLNIPVDNYDIHKDEHLFIFEEKFHGENSRKDSIWNRINE